MSTEAGDDDSAAGTAPADAASKHADAAPARGDDSTDFRQLAHDVAAYARALGYLALSEAALAKVNLVRLLLLALAVPAIVFGILLGIDALLAALFLRLFGDWLLSVVCVLIVNAALFWITLMLLRRWWHSLSLPRSRAALARALEAFK